MQAGPASGSTMPRPFDLIAFDVDGTLVQEARDRTVWEVLNERFIGRSDQNRERYALYREGKLSYAEWVALDVGGWRDAGATRREMVAAFEPLRLVEGAREALDTLKRAGYDLYVISGTLDLLLDTLLPDAPFDEVYANRIGFDHEGKISNWQATQFDMEGKADIFRSLAERRRVPLDRCAYVGDSTNDVWVARAAGFTLAFNPKSPELMEIADVTVRAPDLRAILSHFVSTGG
jgi:phosphoserine phosphatase